MILVLIESAEQKCAEQKNYSPFFLPVKQTRMRQKGQH